MFPSQKTKPAQASQLLQCSLAKAQLVFSTSASFYYSPLINRAIRNTPSKLTTFLRDQRCNRPKEHLSKYHSREESEQSLAELRQYYKFYTQTSILYLPDFFRMMHENRERKKVVDYVRLKKLLDLSDSSEKSEITKRSYLPSFHLISLLNSSMKSQETLLLVALKEKLSHALGGDRYRTIEQIDRDYYFQHRGIEKYGHFQKLSGKRKCYAAIEEKEGKVAFPGEKAKKSKRNNSCDNVGPKKVQNPHRTLIKKKHQSMDNLSHLKYEPSETPLKKKPDNWLSKSKQCTISVKESKGKIRETRTKYTEFDEEQLRQAIRGVKEKIRKEKGYLRKKLTGFSNQSQLTAASKKSTFAATPVSRTNGATNKGSSCKAGNFHFF